MSERRFSQEGRPAVVAHRGAWLEEAENCVPAFEAAVAAGADAVEFDVRLSADGVPVVMHDPDVSRTTDGRGLVCEMTLDQLRRLRIRTAGGGEASVPTLAETLALLSGRVAVDIEIKNIPGEPDFEHDHERALEATLFLLAEFDGGVLVSSFNPFTLARARLLAPEVATGLLTDPGVDAQSAAAFAHEQGFAWVLPYSGQVRNSKQGWIEQAHGWGLLVGTWVVDDPGEVAKLVELGVDAIATNDPASILAARESALG